MFEDNVIAEEHATFDNNFAEEQSPNPFASNAYEPTNPFENIVTEEQPNSMYSDITQERTDSFEEETSQFSSPLKNMFAENNTYTQNKNIFED